MMLPHQSWYTSDGWRPILLSNGLEKVAVSDAFADGFADRHSTTAVCLYEPPKASKVAQSLIGG
jgi:hypothetical protein